MNEPPNGYFPRFFRVPCLENPGENRASSNLWPQSCSLAGGELIRHSSFINHSSIIHQSSHTRWGKSANVQGLHVWVPGINHRKEPQPALSWDQPSTDYCLDRCPKMRCPKKFSGWSYFSLEKDHWKTTIFRGYNLDYHDYPLLTFTISCSWVIGTKFDTNRECRGRRDLYDLSFPANLGTFSVGPRSDQAPG